MTESHEDILDIRGLTPSDCVEGPQSPMVPRPWVGIRFDCCGAYARVYRNPDGSAYTGRCPRCLREVRLRIGAGGTDARFFVAQ